MAKKKVVICPYCGQTQPAGERCRDCGGLFEPLSRLATHNAMGPWFVRDPRRPHQPGCSYETLVQLIERGQVDKYSIVRGPTTRQFWTVAKHVPGVAHLLGYCHNCDALVDSGDHGCHVCGVPFGAYLDRNFLGLPEIHPLPWEPSIDEQNRPGLGDPRDLDWRRSAEPRGLSSFASDEDLIRRSFGPPGNDDPHGRPGARADDQANPATAVATARSGAPSGETDPALAERTLADDVAGGSAVRSMQRRIATQKRTIRLLAVVAVVTLAAALGLLAFASPFGSSPEPSPTVMPQETIDASGAPAEPATDGSAESVEEAEPAPAVPNAPEPEPSPYQSDYERAMELATAAQPTDRPIQDRIGDYEKALEILEGIAADAPANEQPTGLAEQIEHVRRQLERLKLERFFP